MKVAIMIPMDDVSARNAEHLRPEPTAGEDAEAVCLALPATVQETTTHQKGTTFGRVGDGRDGCTVPVDKLPGRSCSAPHDGSEERVYAECCCQGLDEGGREEEVVGGGRWWWSRRRPGSQRELRASQRDEHTRSLGG